MHLDTTYFVENKKLITKNIVAKYFLLLQITIHPFLLLGWSMNSAWTSKKKTTQGKRMQTQLLYTNLDVLLCFT